METCLSFVTLRIEVPGQGTSRSVDQAQRTKPPTSAATGALRRPLFGRTRVPHMGRKCAS